MTSYLLSWNPSRFDWADLPADIAAIRKHGFSEGRWSCGARKHLPRDSEVFLIRLGVEPKGIVAHGRTFKDAHQDEHWDATRARRSDLANYVDVRFDLLAKEPLVKWQDLQKGELSDFRWSIQGSGVELPENIADELRRRLGLDEANRLKDSGGQDDKGGLAWRSDRNAAEGVLDLLFTGQSRSARRVVLQFLARSIQFAHDQDVERWAISLFDDLVRFNVGMVESVVLGNGTISVLVDGDARVPGAELSGRKYARAGGSQLATVAYADAAAVLPRLRDRHENALRLAGKSPCQSSVQAAHSPGVLRYLEDYLDGRLPDPRHWTREQAEDAEEALLRESTLLSPTVRDSLIKARVGQGRFREAVAKLENRCRVTGTDDPTHLRASHIKPWCFSDNQERLDGSNGLMLAPHVDHLFDRGYLSFQDDGTLMVAKTLGSGILPAWGIPEALDVGAFRREQREYLEYHRKHVFGKK